MWPGWAGQTSPSLETLLGKEKPHVLEGKRLEMRRREHDDLVRLNEALERKGKAHERWNDSQGTAHSGSGGRLHHPGGRWAAGKTAEKSLASAMKGMDKIDSALTKAITLPVLGAAWRQESLRLDFNAAMTHSMAIMSDVSKTMRDKLEKTAMSVSGKDRIQRNRNRQRLL